MKFKTFIYLITALFFVNTAIAQSSLTWLGISTNLGYGTGYFYNNQAFFGTQNIAWELFSPSNNLGGSFNIGFGDGGFALSLEANQLTFSQPYTVYDGTDYINHTINAQFYSFGFIFRLSPGQVFYLELGPQYNMLKTVNLDNSSVSEHIVGKFNSGIVGLGIIPYSGQFFDISLGVRGYASFGNLITDEFNFYAPQITDNNVMAVSFMPFIKINFWFAYMGRAGCGAFRIMLNTSSTRTSRVKIRY